MFYPFIAVIPLLAAGAATTGLGSAATLISPGELRAVWSITALDSTVFVVLAAYRCLRFRNDGAI